MAWQSLLTAKLWGFPTFWVGEQSLITNSRKADALLSMLCLTPDARLSRYAAASQLWSDKPDEQARTSLRQALFVLNRGLRNIDFDGFKTSKSDIWIERFDTDEHQLLAQLSAGGPIPQRLMDERFLPMDFLCGLDHLDEQLDVWLRIQRQVAHDRLRGVLEKRLECMDADHGVLPLTQALHNVDPSHEPACRLAMVYLVERGDRAAALRLYNSLWRHLEQEFDIEPSGATQQLVAKIKMDEPLDDNATTRAAPMALSAPCDAAPVLTRPVIVVDGITLEDPSGWLATLANFFRQDLISRLTRFREWLVAEPQAIGQDSWFSSQPIYRLRTAALAEGGAVHLAVTLLDTSSGQVIWGETFRLESDRPLGFQPLLVSKIAIGININVSQEQLRRCSGSAQLSIHHYDRWLRGQHHHFRHLPDDFVQACELYRSLITEQPLFAPAHSALAQTLNSKHLVFAGEAPSIATLTQARGYAQKAQGLDSFDSRAHLAAAWTAKLLGRFDEAQTHLQMALDLNENDPWSLVSIATGLAFCGKCDLAVRLATRAEHLGLALNPIQWGYFSALYFVAGDYEKAASCHQQAVRGFPITVPFGIAALVEVGELALAQEHCSEYLCTVERRWTEALPIRRDAIISWIATCFPVASEVATGRMLAGFECAVQ